MLSRVAESLYWISRYMERAENIARAIDVNLQMCLDVPGDPQEQWQPLVDITGDRAAFAARYPTSREDSVIHFLGFDGDHPNSILSSVRNARENARWIRQFITLEMWEQLNKFYLMLTAREAEETAMDEPHGFFTEVMMASQLFTGITEATLSRGEGWHFCRLGRMLERADQTSRILDVRYFHLLPSAEYVGTPYDDLLWAAVLRSISAFEMYRKRHHQITPSNVLGFLVLDREFPRAIHHCVSSAEEALRAISETPDGTFRNSAERLLGRLSAELHYADVDEIMGSGVHEFLDGLQQKLNQVGTAVFETFFALRPLTAAGAEGNSQ